MKKVEIAYIKTDFIDIDDLKPFQGSFKKLSNENYNKLKKQILETDFAFALNVWQCDKQIYIIGGHQRVAVLKRLRNEGIEVPKIPCNFIRANDFLEAKNRVLQDVSQFGKIDKEGAIEFFGEDEIVLENFDLPDFDIKQLLDEQPEEKKEPKEPTHKEEFLIVIEALDESEQNDIYEQLQEMGVKCKIM